VVLHTTPWRRKSAVGRAPIKMVFLRIYSG
jgi:hypothetical protein